MKIWLAEQKVILNRRVYKSHWRNQDDQYWFARLLEEVAELGMALQGEHEHKPELELTQIAGICTNWLEKKESDKTNVLYCPYCRSRQVSKGNYYKSPTIPGTSYFKYYCEECHEMFDVPIVAREGYMRIEEEE